MAKRRANGEGNIRKRKDGRWEGRYSAGYDPDTGKRIIKNVLGKTQAEVKEKPQAALQEAEVLDVSRADGCTVAEWINTWFDTYSKPNIRPSTTDYYRRFIDCHIVPVLGNIKLKDWTTRHIQKLYNDLKDHGRVRESQKEKTPGLSNAYIRGLQTMLHNCLNRAVKERLILRNLSDDCIVPKQQKKEMKILQVDQVNVYLKAADERGALLLFFLELVTGLRKGELVALLWSDLDLEKQTLSVSKQITARNGQTQITRPKMETSIRQISVSQEVIDLLVQEHEKHPDNPYMFPSPKTGEMYHPDSVVNLHKKILKDAGLEHIRFHDLRHTFATMALQNGVDVKTVSSMLGHFDAGFTLRTYTHATRQKQDEAAREIGGLLAQVIYVKQKTKRNPISNNNPTAFI